MLFRSECGSNVLSGCEADSILNLTSLVTSQAHSWQPPVEYLAEHVAATVCRLLLGYRVPDLAEQGWQARKASAAQAANER